MWQHRSCWHAAVGKEVPPLYWGPRTWARMQTCSTTPEDELPPPAADIFGGTDPLLAWGWEWVALIRRGCWLSRWGGEERWVSWALPVNPPAQSQAGDTEGGAGRGLLGPRVSSVFPRSAWGVLTAVSHCRYQGGPRMEHLQTSLNIYGCL